MLTRGTMLMRRVGSGRSPRLFIILFLILGVTSSEWSQAGLVWTYDQGWAASGLPRVADTNGNGNLEVVLGGQVTPFEDTGILLVLDKDGQPLFGSPHTYPRTVYELMSHDFDGDGTAEIFHGGSNAYLGILEPSGDHSQGWPDLNITCTSSAVMDIDNDGDFELLCCGVKRFAGEGILRDGCMTFNSDGSYFYPDHDAYWFSRGENIQANQFWIVPHLNVQSLLIEQIEKSNIRSFLSLCSVGRYRQSNLDS